MKEEDKLEFLSRRGKQVKNSVRRRFYVIGIVLLFDFCSYAYDLLIFFDNPAGCFSFLIMS